MFSLSEPHFIATDLINTGIAETVHERFWKKIVMHPVTPDLCQFP